MSLGNLYFYVPLRIMLRVTCECIQKNRDVVCLLLQESEKRDTQRVFGILDRERLRVIDECTIVKVLVNLLSLSQRRKQFFQIM